MQRTDASVICAACLAISIITIAHDTFTALARGKPEIPPSTTPHPSKTRPADWPPDPAKAAVIFLDEWVALLTWPDSQDAEVASTIAAEHTPEADAEESPAFVLHEPIVVTNPYRDYATRESLELPWATDGKGVETYMTFEPDRTIGQAARANRTFYDPLDPSGIEERLQFR
jgi:hypothetical protein